MSDNYLDSSAVEYLAYLWSNVPEGVDLTLIGGGALFYWSSVYYPAFPDFFSDEPLGTKDIDFWASSDAVRKCHQHWGGKLIEPDAGDFTPEIAVLEIKTGQADTIQIDFLNGVFGIKDERARKNRVPLGDGNIFVLSEFMLLTSRVMNTVRLPFYRSPYALGQLRQSVSVVKAAIATRLQNEDFTDATKLAHKLLDLTKSQAGVHLFVYYGIDILDGWVESCEYSQPFLEKAKPVLWREIERKRKSLQSRQKS